MNVTGRILFGAAIFLGVIGCNPAKTTAPKADSSDFKGVELSVLLEKSSPLVDALPIRLADWEAKTGAKVKLVETDDVTGKADLYLVSGNLLPMVADPAPLTESVLLDPKLIYREFAPLYRLVFNTRNQQTIAVPLATDQILLWYRADLFEDPAIGKAYEKEHKVKLEPPVTWTDYLRVAKFFHAHPSVPFGCVEPTDRSRESSRVFFAHCAGYAKGPNWSSFAIDSETGKPLLATSPFVRGLAEWLEARKHSPAADGKAIDAATAARLFRDGEAAMLIARVPPTAYPDAGAAKSRFAEHIGVRRLPAGDTLFDPKTDKPVSLEAPNRCVHLGATGWYIALGKSENPAAAENLLLFLAQADESFYLVQGCRRGLLPIRPALLNEPQRFRGYGLSPKTVSQLFDAVRSGIEADNWVADPRTSLSPVLLESLADCLVEAQSGKLEPAKALEKASQQWEQAIEPHKKAFLDEYRDSLGLPRLIKSE